MKREIIRTTVEKLGITEQQAEKRVNALLESGIIKMNGPFGGPESLAAQIAIDSAMHIPQAEDTEDQLQKLMDWNFDFAKRVFPEHAADPISPLEHAKEEIKEIIQSIEDTEPRDKTLEEYADALILITGSARRKKFTARELIQKALWKMDKNEKRDWGKPNEKGIYKHLK